MFENCYDPIRLILPYLNRMGCDIAIIYNSLKGAFMQNHSPHLRIIGQLAREYDEKYRQLEKQISEISPDGILPRLIGLADRTTDHFRSAQVSLLSMPGLFEGEQGESAVHAITAMCRAFDEMRVLFHCLIENRQEDPGKP
jgi:hypothetical protein